MRTPTLLSSVLLAILASCGGGSPETLIDDGVAALNKSDYQTAKKNLGNALETLEPSDPLFKKAKMKHVEAQVHLDAEAAKSEFLAFAEASPDAVAQEDYRAIGSKLTSAKKYKQAIQLLDAAVQKYGQDERLMKMLEAIEVAANAEGDEDALGALAGLGYIG